MTPTLAEMRAGAAEHHRALTERTFLSVSDLAGRWRLSPTTVRDIPADELPYLEFGRGVKLRRRRYDPADVAEYEFKHRKGAPAAEDAA